MRPDEVARRMDNRPGYELITYREVGLPVFGLHATALLLERQESNCIEEFTLRAVAAGLEAPAQIEGILGLPRVVIDPIFADLVRQEALDSRDGGSRLVLTRRGRELNRIARRRIHWG